MTDQDLLMHLLGGQVDGRCRSIMIALVQSYTYRRRVLGEVMPVRSTLLNESLGTEKRLAGLQPTKLTLLLLSFSEVMSACGITIKASQ